MWKKNTLPNVCSHWYSQVKNTLESQTCKELTPILHLVINTLQRKRLRTNFKPNGSTFFKVYQNFGHIFSLNPVEIYVTLDLPEHSMSPLTIYFPYGQTQVATEEKRSRTEFVWYLTWIKLKVKSIFITLSIL